MDTENTPPTSNKTHWHELDVAVMLHGLGQADTYDTLAVRLGRTPRAIEQKAGQILRGKEPCPPAAEPYLAAARARPGTHPRHVADQPVADNHQIDEIRQLLRLALAGQLLSGQLTLEEVRLHLEPKHTPAAKGIIDFATALRQRRRRLAGTSDAERTPHPEPTVPHEPHEEGQAHDKSQDQETLPA